MRGLFVTGTGTGVGKTIVSAALLASMRAAGEPVQAYKPVLTGLDEPPGAWPPDHELLALAAGADPDVLAPLRYGPPVSPHLAAQMQNERIDPARLIEHAHTLARAGTLVVEGVGGLLVPLTETFTVCDLAAALDLPVVIAAPPTLGTINHTLLTLRVARAAGLRVVAVVLTPWPKEPSALEQSNRETIGLIGGVETEVLPEIAAPDSDALKRSGEGLPWRRWIFSPSDRSSAPLRPADISSAPFQPSDEPSAPDLRGRDDRRGHLG
jgi:dethiobiotin synthetase